MPRKNRCAALALVFAIFACLAGQAAAAMPLAGPRIGADFAGGDFVGAVWTWLVGHIGSPAPAAERPALAASPKSAGGSDPNSGGSHAARHLVIRGGTR